MKPSNRTSSPHSELHEKIAVLEQQLSEYKKNEKQLQVSKHRYQAMVDNMKNGIAVYRAVDNGNNFVCSDFNSACEQIEKISRHEVIGKPVTDAFPDFEESGLLSVFRQVWQSGKPEHFPVTQYKGHSITGYCNHYVYKLDSDEIVNVYDDVTELKQIEYKLKRACDIINRSPSVAFTWKNVEGWPVKFVSKNVEQLTGYSAEELSSGHISYADIIFPDDLAKVTSEVEYASNDRDRNRFRHEPYRIVTKSNVLKWVADNTYIQRDSKGRTTHYHGIVEDITDRKTAETALRESEERSRDIMDNSSDFIMIIGPDFHLVYANRSLQKALGCTEEEVPHISMMNVIHPDNIPSCSKKFQRLMSGEDVGVIESLFRVRDGRVISVEGRCNCKYINGNPAYIRSIFRDTTVQKRLQLELQQAQKLESIGILAGGTAHDFNNLLAGLAGVITVIRSSLPRDDDRYQVLTEALDSCMSGKEITSKFITFAEGDSPIKSRIKIDTLLKETVEASSSEFHVQCNFILTDDLWLADVDESHFRQLVRNMTINGCEAMSGKGVLTVTTENVLLDEGDDSSLEKGRYIRIDIKDQGIGIPKENLDKIFLPYFSTKKRANVKGMGLGLTVCSSIIKKHKGKISVDTTPNEGTTFNIYLPAFTTA
jgi:PAS domain S-box-containing protein